MSDAAEKSESLRDYAEMLGSPDPTTTARMRARLDDYMLRRRALRRRWLLAGLGAVALAVAAALIVRPDGSSPAVIEAEHGRTIEVGSTRLVLHPGARVALDEHDDARVELLAGELEVTLVDDRPFAVTTGEFEVHANAGAFTIRHTDALPIVTALRDEALVRGPGLPAEGIRVLASAP